MSRRSKLIYKAAALPVGNPERRALLSRLAPRRAGGRRIAPQALRSSFQEILLYALSEALQAGGVEVSMDDGGMIVLEDGTSIGVYPGMEVSVRAERYDNDLEEEVPVFSQSFPWTMSPFTMAKRVAGLLTR
jgi:hypothetical protein